MTAVMQDEHEGIDERAARQKLACEQTADSKSQAAEF